LERPFVSSNMVVVAADKPVLVHMGYGEDPACTEGLLVERGTVPADLSFAVNTHHHGDHAGDVTRKRVAHLSWVADEYEVVVDAERGVLLRRASRLDKPWLSLVSGRCVFSCACFSALTHWPWFLTPRAHAFLRAASTTSRTASITSSGCSWCM
jgi:hypothetical protein